MRNTSEQQEILGLENRYWRAVQDHDVGTAVSLTRFPCIVSGPQGARAIDEPTYRKMMRAHVDQVKSFEIRDEQIEVLNSETAVIAYRLESNGESCFDTSTWIREGGEWRCALHTETPLQTQASSENKMDSETGHLNPEPTESGAI